MATDPNPEELISIFDSIIPGKTRIWPPYSRSNSSAYTDIARISERNRETLVFITQKARSGTSLRQSIETEQAKNPQAFARLYRDLCDSYYSSPTVVALVAELADAGPREASEHFDQTLLEKVVATQAGKGRF